MDWHVGTMGFGYKDWSGSFYPPDVKPPHFLRYYARHFDCVELDTTFHAAPTPDRVAKWNDETPAGFRFCVKTPRAVTHDAPLASAHGDMLAFLDVLRALGDKLAVILLQFPPALTVRARPMLDSFLSKLPKDLRYAIEFRDPSWREERTADVLEKHNAGWVAAEYEDAAFPLRPTAEFLYLRLIGIHGRFERHAHEQLDPTDKLALWRDWVGRQDLRGDVFAMLNNDYSGSAVETALRWRKMLNARGAVVEEQPRLF